MKNNRIISIAAFIILTLLWLGFFAALIFNPAILDNAWNLFLGWNLVVQVIVGLLFLPVVAGLWIWESSLPFLVRLILVIGLGAVTIYAFLPRELLQARRGGEKAIHA